MNRKQRRANGKAGQPPSPAADVRDPITLHAQGVEAYRAGDLAGAASLIAGAIAANGQMPDFHYNLAIVLRAQGQLKNAAACYENAIALKPDYADAHNNLGNVFKALGEKDKAQASFARALQVRPSSADAHYNLGILCSEAGDRDQAARHFNQCLDCDPQDSRGVRMLLAHLELGSAPQRTTEAQLQKIYDVRSHFWDQETSYFAPALVAEALREHIGDLRPDILDIGCGTGLAGARVRALAGRLDGVDLSPAMLRKARDKGLYDRLHEADLLSFMSEHKDSYDTILGAATLIHFGDLRALFQAAAACLRPCGLFVFTLFANEVDGADFAVAADGRLAQSGCFWHSAAYVERLASETGFTVPRLKRVVHEHDQNGDPVAGILAVLRLGPQFDRMDP